MDLAAALALAATLWHALPHGDTAWDVLETIAPFTFTEPMNTGGTLTGTPPAVGSEASSPSQASFRLGLVDVTDPGPGGRPLLYPDLSLAARVQVRGAASEVDSGAPGPVVTLIPKSGGATWVRDVGLAVSPSAVLATGSRVILPVARLRSLGRMHASAGGPLTRRVHAFGAASGTWSSHVERAETFALPGDAFSIAVHPTFAVSASRRAEATAWIQQTKTPLAGRALLRDRHALASQSYRGLTASWAGGAARTFEVTGLIASTHVTPRAGASAAFGTVERLVDGPIESLVNETGGARERQEIDAAISAGSRFRLNAGVGAARGTMTASPFGTGLIGETIDGVPARAWQYGFAGESRRSASSAYAHVAGTAQLPGGIGVDAGVRVEHLRGSARGSTDRIAWTSWEPRLALRYAYGPAALMVTARRYHARLPLTTLAAGDPAGPSGRVYLWTDRNGDGLVQDGERGALVSLVGPGSPTAGFSTIHPALRRPHVAELMASIDWRVKRWASLRFAGVTRRGGRLLARYNTGAPPSIYSTYTVFDPGLDLLGPEDDQMLPIYRRPPSSFGLDRYVLSNVPSMVSTYGALYIGLTIDQGPRWQTILAGTMLRSYAPGAFRGYHPSENDEMIVGDSFSDPNSFTYAEGRTIFDRGYGLKVTSTVNAGRRVSLSAVGRYADGQNFARLVVVPDLPQGRDVVRAYANGKSKFTFTATLDLRLQKRVTWRARDVALAVEAYNALNLRNEVEEVTVSGPLWRLPTFTQPPRVLRFTAGVTF